MSIKIKWETAENMMNIVAFTACQSFIENNAEIDLEAIQDFARSTFEDYCKVMGITDVEEPEEEEEDFDNDFDNDFDDFDDVDFDDDDDDEEEEYDGEDEMESIIYRIGNHRGISEEDAHLLVSCVAKNIKEEFDFLSDKLTYLLIKGETLRIAREWGIEVVDTNK